MTSSLPCVNCGKEGLLTTLSEIQGQEIISVCSWTLPMLDVQGHLVGSLCVQQQPKQAAFHNSLNKDVFGRYISEMHFTSFSLQMECFPAETVQHAQESMWSKESSLSHCSILGYKSVHFLNLIFLDWWLWEALLKKKETATRPTPPPQPLSFSFGSH